MFSAVRDENLRMQLAKSFTYLKKPLLPNYAATTNLCVKVLKNVRSHSIDIALSFTYFKKALMPNYAATTNLCVKVLIKRSLSLFRFAKQLNPNW